MKTDRMRKCLVLGLAAAMAFGGIAGTDAVASGSWRIQSRAAVSSPAAAYAGEAMRLRQVNMGQQAESKGMINTTARQMGFAFYGVGSQDACNQTLAALAALGVKGTFYVSLDDFSKNRAMINQIVAQGHSLEIALLEKNGSDYTSIASTILAVRASIAAASGQNATLVHYPYRVNETADLMEAVSATGSQFISDSLATANSALGKDATAEDVMNKIFNKGNLTVSRGYIIYCRMDYYNNPSIVAELINRIKTEKIDPTDAQDGNGPYQIVSLRDMLASDKIYSYPVSSDRVPEQIRNKISAGKLSGLSSQAVLELISGAYIGTPTEMYSSGLPGFTDSEIRQHLNTRGRFTGDPTLFLSFDDWGSDGAINKLLGVLDKYQVKATFFIRTNYVEANPNLLRAIAEAGHDIASHTDQHLVLADGDESLKTPLSAEERDILEADVITSYNKLQSIVGDVVDENGAPALTTFLRPPTLAVSRVGLEAVLDAGYTHIVSGDFSTHDYDATGANVITERFYNGIPLGQSDRIRIQNGSVIVMHMSDNAKYTAAALDQMIPYYQSQGYTFERLSTYLVNGGGAGAQYKRWLSPGVKNPDENAEK